jgi:hypothetical protein
MPPYYRNSVFTVSGFAKVAGGILAVTGILTLVLLIFDQFIWGVAPINAFFLIIFAAIDLVVGILLYVKPEKLIFLFVAVWSGLRIAFWVGAIFEAPSFGITFAEMADYLFNPIKTTPPNPSGVPGFFIDVIVILEFVVIAFAILGAYKRPQFPPPNLYWPYWNQR